MKHKKLLVIILVLTMVMVGCAPSSMITEEQKSVEIPTTAIEVRPFSFKIAAGDSDGLWYQIANLIGTQVTENIPQMDASAKSTTAVIDNLKLMTSGKVDMAFGYDYHVILANQGKLASVFPNAPVEKLNIKCGVEITRPAFPDYAQPNRREL